MSVTLIRKSFEAVRPRAQELADDFYARLFERYPQVRPMFARTDMTEQKSKLLQALALLVANLEKPEVLRTYLGALGTKHAGYGARPEHYTAVGECLLASLAHVAGDLWTEELKSAWADTYSTVASLMQQRVAVPAPAPAEA